MKKYPNIDLNEYVTLYSKRPGSKPVKVKCLVRSMKRITRSSVSPGYPVLLQENGFFTQTTFIECIPRAFDPFHGDPNNPGYTYIESFSEVGFTGPPQELDTDLYYKALNRLYSDIPKVTANLALLYAERKKTYESIVKALTGIVRFVRQVKKLKAPELFMDAGTLAGRKRFSGAWLNYTYGIAPLCSDLHALGVSEVRAIQYLKSSAHAEYSSFVDLGLNSAFSSEGVHRVSMKFGLALAGPLHATLAGAGLTNPATVLWEVTPFSFMADWIFPIGPYLEMLSSTSGYDKESGSVTRHTRELAKIYGPENGSASGTYKQIVRDTSAFPDAPFPRFKNPISPVHGLNLLSIIHQMTKPSR